MPINRLGGLSRRLGGLAGRFALMAGTQRSGGGELLTGLNFVDNDDLSNEIKHGFYLGGSALPDITPLTVMLKARPRQQSVAGGIDTYYTFWFHGRSDGSFVGDNHYVGAHPYPETPGFSTDQLWSLAAYGNDNTTDQNANDTSVVFDQWYEQATRVQANGSSGSDVDFYWNLAVNINRHIRTVVPNPGLVAASQTPRLMFGETYWATERGCGVIRGFQVYQAALSDAHIQALRQFQNDKQVLDYCAANSLTPWYLNMNPRPDDITDKSGAGHHGTWMDATNKPTLWSSG